MLSVDRLNVLALEVFSISVQSVMSPGAFRQFLEFEMYLLCLLT